MFHLADRQTLLLATMQYFPCSGLLVKSGTTAKPPENRATDNTTAIAGKERDTRAYLVDYQAHSKSANPLHNQSVPLGAGDQRIF